MSVTSEEKARIDAAASRLRVYLNAYKSGDLAGASPYVLGLGVIGSLDLLCDYILLARVYLELHDPADDLTVDIAYLQSRGWVFLTDGEYEDAWELRLKDEQAGEYVHGRSTSVLLWIRNSGRGVRFFVTIIRQPLPGACAEGTESEDSVDIVSGQKQLTRRQLQEIVNSIRLNPG